MEHSVGRWKTIFINDSKYSICSIERDGNWNIFLTNLVDMWKENLDASTILKKCEDLNPSLSVEDIKVEEIVGPLLADVPKYVKTITLEKIELVSELEGGFFNFTIDLTRGSAQELWEEVTMPMCCAASELQRRHNILLKLVKAKDEEISEYKLNGAELVRKHIETKAFSDDFFKKDIPIQSPENCQDAFQEIMELQVEFKMKRPVKTEKRKTCTAEQTEPREAVVKTETEENLRSRQIDSASGNGTLSEFEGNVTEMIRESNIILPKAEPSSSPKSANESKVSLNTENNRNSPKRAPSVRTSPVKRPKKTIHDFIT